MRAAATVLAATLMGAACAPAPQPVTALEAADLFLSACLSQAPGFTTSEGLFATAGLSPVQTGTYFHPTGDVSAKVLRREGASTSAVMRCSVVYEGRTSEAVTALLTERLVAATGGESSPVQINVGGKPALAWRVTVNGASGSVIHLPNGGQGAPGALFAEFPILGV
ncbi:MAG: hypothetical protein AAGK00_05755 [Pseudomonadota bacterium]